MRQRDLLNCIAGAYARSTSVILWFIVSILGFLLITEILASVAHWESKVEAFLTHQVTNRIVAKQPSQKCKNATSLCQSRRAGYMTVSGCEVRCCYECEGQLNSEEDADVHCVQSKASNEEKEIPHCPHYIKLARRHENVFVLAKYKVSKSIIVCGNIIPICCPYAKCRRYDRSKATVKEAKRR